MISDHSDDEDNSICGVPRYVQFSDSTDKEETHKQRVINTLPLYISNDIKITVNIYVLIREMKKPLPITIRKRDNEILKKETIWKRVDTNVPVESENVKPTTTIAGEQIAMEKEDLANMKNDEIGFRLIGFKPKPAIKVYHYVSPGYFIYPNESEVKGSTKLYSALHNRCLANDVVAIVKGVIRKSSTPRLMALVPVDDEFLQGFYVFVLPFADDLRPVAVPTLFRYEDAKLKNAMSAVIERLTRVYSPDEIKNPVLQKFWAYIQALASNASDAKTVTDMTDPGFHFCDSTISKLAAEIQMRLPKENKPKNEPDVHESWKKGELEKVKVQTMKDYIQEKGLNIPTSQRKADLIIALSKYFKQLEKM
ncbi:X-ray repair cross-complementing protein 6 [Tetranychus urticae]|uniref:Ku domain-containing protein n=1 Tax=Tetranychus urticae TaxID=32264 RepID=T1K0Y7_TETUR|nr:X-ray repair cross-complementing protein 6 [Tetranychus urticae]